MEGNGDGAVSELEAGPQPSPRLPGWLLAVLAGGGLLIVVLLVVVIVLLTGGDDDPADVASDSASPSGSPEAETFLVTGSITLTDGSIGSGGGECWGADGYDDMSGGAQVVVKDAAGVRVAVGALDPGVKMSSIECRFDFRVEDVPSGSAVYSIEVAHRGEVSFTEDEAVGLDLTLG